MVFRITQFWHASADKRSRAQSRTHFGQCWSKWLVLILICGLACPSTLSAQETKTTEGKQKAAAKDLELSSSAPNDEPAKSAGSPAETAVTTTTPVAGSGLLSVSKASVLVGSLTVFLLSVFVGFEVINKVPPTLHTPLMSGSNAISGITVVGAMLTAGSAIGGFGSLLGFVAIVLATINVVGGFLVTHRMLIMFKKR